MRKFEKIGKQMFVIINRIKHLSWLKHLVLRFGRSVHECPFQFAEIAEHLIPDFLQLHLHPLAHLQNMAIKIDCGYLFMDWESIFATHGIQELVSDGEPPFNSEAFRGFFSRLKCLA
ncbi:hypothetical protein AVEN_251185-1 [Araneus ventricosus]|uniref:Uncharacterized protein n=1 Tax=Araneus ventricosus TaxID=182803 RepID=A0A4Y2QFZ6_ARAVE|nr:hypothetical protein AVEN_251185-1 [Araneus ventricosus]